jgi:3-phosphoshikimate 1-carboxyvinyltransferase
MTVRIHRRGFAGDFRVPASKSHTIRRLIIAALADGESVIEHPLDSLDAASCAAFVRALGAEVRESRAADPASPNPPDGEGRKLTRWIVRPAPAPRAASSPSPAPVRVDVGNSGTTLFLGMSAASLWGRPFVFDGDEQIRRRSAGPLLEALSRLGAAVSSAANGCAPLTVRGPLVGGRARLPSHTSQYLSGLLLAAPLAPSGTVTEIEVPLLNERPYIEMTLAYLAAQRVPFEAAADFSFFRVPGGASYKPVNGPVSGDFSSAAFPAAAAAITGGPVVLWGLDPEDTQGDKAIFPFLERMGCEVSWRRERSADTERDKWAVTVSRSGALSGGVFDLNATPDLLPVMAVLGAYGEGRTALVNAAHARLKETDRVAVMAGELAKLGVRTEEAADGLVIHGNRALFARSRPPAALDGRGDHRVVMALAALGLGASFPFDISGAECANVTYPGFLPAITGAGEENGK